MLFVVLCIAGGVLVGYALGGSLRRLEALALRRIWLLLLALVVQIIASLTLSHGAFTTALIASLVLAVGFLLSNPQLSGKTLIGVGLAANALVIAANGAMPVSLDAAATAGISTGKIADDARHQIAEPGTHLRWLDDHIPLALPGEPEALSPGDVAVAAGAALMVVSAMRRRTREPDPIPRRPSAEAGGPDPDADPSTDELPVLATVGATSTLASTATKTAGLLSTAVTAGSVPPAPVSAPFAAPSAEATLPAPTPDALPARPGTPAPLADPARRPRLPRRRPPSAAASPPVVRPPWTPLPVRTPGTGRPAPPPGPASGRPPAAIPASYRSPAPGARTVPAGAGTSEPLEPGPASLRRRSAPQDPARPAAARLPAPPGSPLARLATPIAARTDDPMTLDGAALDQSTLGPMELQPEPLSRRASRAPTPPSASDPPPVP